MYGPPPNAPKATCAKCGNVYVDWEDYSGPAHSLYDCNAALAQRVFDAEAKLKLTRDLADSWIAECEASLGAHDHADPLCSVCIGARAIKGQLTQLFEHIGR